MTEKELNEQKTLKQAKFIKVTNPDGRVNIMPGINYGYYQKINSQEKDSKKQYKIEVASDGEIAKYSSQPAKKEVNAEVIQKLDIAEKALQEKTAEAKENSTALEAEKSAHAETAKKLESALSDLEAEKAAHVQTSEKLATAGKSANENATKIKELQQEVDRLQKQIEKAAK